MLNLKALTEEFIETKFRFDFEEDTNRDQEAVKAVQAKETNRPEREEAVRNWLNYYKVIRYFPPAGSREISACIIEFADKPRPNRLFQDRRSIVSEFKKLEERIQSVAPRSPKSRKAREVTSLTSKALWCCYPHDVPIFDNYAVRALQVISRICHMTAEPTQEGYERFINMWFQLYDRVKPTIDQADLGGYPYKVRVLDRLLWHLGEPSFDRPDVA